MPDPFLLIVGMVAIACLVLFPIRIWRKHHHRYGDADDADTADGDVPLPPPERRNRG